MRDNNNSPYIAGGGLWALIVFLVGCVGPPQSGKNLPTAAEPTVAPQSIQITVFSGIPRMLDHYLQLNPDCTSLGMPTVFVTSAPSHGSVAIQKNVESYPNFEPTNQRSDCNDKETASVGILYTSEKTFIGVDRFTVHSVSKFGQLLIRDYVVTVEYPHIAEPARAQP